MFYQIIKVLKNSKIVKDFSLIEFIEEELVKILKIKAISILFITEVHTSNMQKYSYHWQDQKGNLKIRWDNSPHWSNIETFPHHKHLKDKIVSSVRPTIFEVLKEIENVLRG